jgi:Flp pilus assembly protein CpaB
MLKHLVILSIGLTFAMLAGYSTWQRIARAEGLVQTRNFLTYASNAADPVARQGTVLSGPNVVAVALPVAAQVQPQMPLIEDTPENRRFVSLQAINQDVPRGRFLTFDLFQNLGARRLSEVVPPGMRLMTINVTNTSSLNHLLRPGDRVDLLSVPSRFEAAEVTEASVVLGDVKVVAVGEYFTLEEYVAARRTSFSTITLEVDLADAQLLAARNEQQTGGFHIVLRNRCDSGQDALGCN